MNPNRPPSPFDPRGTKIAFLALAAAANIAAGLAFFSLVDWLMLTYGDLMTGIDTTLMLGMFLVSLMIGFVMSQIAADGRGVTYGVYGGRPGSDLRRVRRAGRSGALGAAHLEQFAAAGGLGGIGMRVGGL